MPPKRAPVPAPMAAPRIAGNRATDGTDGSPASAAAQDAAFRRLLWGRRRDVSGGLAAGRWVRGIEPGLLDRPAMALEAVSRLLLLALPLGGIDKQILCLGRQQRGLGQEEPHRQGSHDHFLDLHIAHSLLPTSLDFGDRFQSWCKL